MTLRQKLNRYCAVLMVLSFPLLFYGRTIEPYNPKTVTTSIRFENRALSNGDLPITVLLMSDLHVCDEDSIQLLEDAIKLGLESKPDIIFLTGDYVTSHLFHKEAYVSALKKLSEFAPVYATLGNHDGGNWSGPRYGATDTDDVISLLRESNITCLSNTAVDCVVNDVNLHIIGLGDFWAGDFSPSKHLFERASDQFTIVLSHNPDTRPILEQYKWELMLSGHTHGGQMDLPIIDNIYVPVRHKE